MRNPGNLMNVGKVPFRLEIHKARAERYLSDSTSDFLPGGALCNGTVLRLPILLLMGAEVLLCG